MENNTQDSSIRPAAKRRLLLVDDDRGITATLSSILQEHDFEVTIASTVAEAIAAIHADPFDVLISDLNIHQAADGFTIINEMRRLQPEAVTIVLTGFPAYASALKAISIHERVDDFIIKPADVPTLLNSIAEKLQHRAPPPALLNKRLSAVLRENTEAIVGHWLAQVKAAPEFAAVALADDERSQGVAEILNGLAARVDGDHQPTNLQAPDSPHAHARRRQAQGYTISLMVEELRILHDAILWIVQSKLLEIDLNFIIPDLVHVADGLALQLQWFIQLSQHES